MAFCLVAGASLTLGLVFAIAGAWPVLPWSLIEVSVLAVAFACLERRAREWERLTVQGDSVIVERARGGTLERRVLRRHWLRVESEPACMLLRSGGEACEFGAALPADARGELATRLRRLLAQ
jgi:uncharacterized membrane protein